MNFEWFNITELTRRQTQKLLFVSNLYVVLLEITTDGKRRDSKLLCVIKNP